MTETPRNNPSPVELSPVDLSRFDNCWYSPGRGRLVQALWFFLGLPVLRCSILPSSGLRVGLLRWFGARIGRGVVIKPGVRVKYPWHLTVGDSAWIGEDVWIDNLTTVEIGPHACVSQGAYLCTGNHDWSDPAFGLRLGPIRIGPGAWVGAHAVLLPGTEMGAGAIAAAGSVAGGVLVSAMIYRGNPAEAWKGRKMGQLEKGKDAH